MRWDRCRDDGDDDDDDDDDAEKPWPVEGKDMKPRMRPSDSEMGHPRLEFRSH